MYAPPAPVVLPSVGLKPCPGTHVREQGLWGLWRTTPALKMLKTLICARDLGAVAFQPPMRNKNIISELKSSQRAFLSILSVRTVGVTLLVY